MKKLITLENISKTYINSKTDKLHVLDNISFSVKKGHIVGFLGQSGCGKSTLLKIIAGLIPFDTGTYTIENLNIDLFLKQQNIGFVFQKATLLPWLNVLENLVFPLKIKQSKQEFDKETAKSKALDLLDKFGISNYHNYYPKELSGGMLQRASVARAFMTNPSVLLLDEPFNSIDEKTREELWVDLRNFWKSEETTVILVTHSVREAIFFQMKFIFYPPSLQK